MDTTTTTQPRSHRLLGAVASATAVAFLGTAILAPAAAQAAGVATGHRLPAPPPVPVADPTSLTVPGRAGAVVTYRVTSGRFDRV
ncbi:hypothetical protein [Knoellia locipacati]|uniref:hypothetical protein n=1 Tax=Knoellia locipacati TaxID=882824 RepID=UPI0011BF51A5|nr:hypothetical protein [Knoellia locipacati]